MALKREDDTSAKELIHHSDRCQYASKEYTSLLKEYGITISMTENGIPKDNAQAERINNIMKNELLKGKVFYDIKDVKEAVEKVVLFYNTRTTSHEYQYNDTPEGSHSYRRNKENMDQL